MSRPTEPGLKVIDCKITVAIRNDGPMVFANDVPSYRLVQINLTQDQLDKIQLKYTHTSGGNKFHESFSRCYLEAHYETD